MIVKTLHLLVRSLLVICLLQSSVNAGNWNSGSSDPVDATLANCMAAGLRNFESVMSKNPELFVKLMGKETIPVGFEPVSPRQRLFVKLASQFDQPIAQDDKAAILRMMTPNCDYSRLARAGGVYRLIAEIAEKQENILRRSLSRDTSVSYAEVTELMVGSAQIDIQAIMSRASEQEINEFMKRFEHFSKNSNFNSELKKFTDQMAEVFALYEMEYIP